MYTSSFLKDAAASLVGQYNRAGREACREKAVNFLTITLTRPFPSLHDQA
jgi:hypothetical protein